VSTVRLRQTGFIKLIDTEVPFERVRQALTDRKVLPPEGVSQRPVAGCAYRAAQTASTEAT